MKVLAIVACVLATAANHAQVGPCDLVEEGGAPAITVDATLVAYDPSFEAMTLTHNPGHYLPLVVRVTRVVEGDEDAKYLLINYCYTKRSGEEWPQELRRGMVRFTATLTRTPNCDSTLDGVLTQRVLDANSGTEGRVGRLNFLLDERIGTHEGMIPCYEFDSRSYTVHP